MKDNFGNANSATKSHTDAAGRHYSQARAHLTEQGQTLLDTNRAKAILFDLDGVLTPTAAFHQQAWKTMFSNYFEQKGVEPYTDQDYFDYLDGRRRDEAIQSICESRGITLDYGTPEDTAEHETVVGLGVRKNEDFLASVSAGIEAYSGSRRLVQLLFDVAKHREADDEVAYPYLAVVSSSKNTKSVLDSADLAQFFDLVVDGNTATENGLAGKPAPDTYVYAAQQLGVEPADAVIFEDAISGVQAGNAGGFGQVIGVNRGAGREELAKNGATVVIDDLSELFVHGIHEPNSVDISSPIRRKKRRNFPPARADQHHHMVNAEGLMDRENNPVDEWRLVETHPQRMPIGLSETLFALANGYIGMRANPPEGRDSAEHGTYINGLHETWDIKHAEDAYGLARSGQSIINAPDAKAMRLYIDDEPLRLGNAEVNDYERSLDFREGVLRRRFNWRTPAGKNVSVNSDMMVSFQEKHVAVMSLEVKLLDADAAVVIHSQILNRQDGEDEFHDQTKAQGTELDPRRAAALEDRVLIPTFQSESKNGERSTLAFRCANSGMTVSCGMDHTFSVTTPDGSEPYLEVTQKTDEDNAYSLYHVNAPKGAVIRLEKIVAYHSSRHVRGEELAFRCERTLNRVHRIGVREMQENQREWLEEFWKRSDVVIHNQPALQQAVRWNIWQLIQASARAEIQGIPAKGMTGTGYGGHYFWDTEVYVTPFLTYTSPQYSRNALRFRWNMLEAAWDRADELAHDGALFPWRTINGQESSAYYAAGTAQYHIDADIIYAMMKYVYATGDQDFLLHEGADLLISTARFWMSLGFFDKDREEFQIHSVTGPDEYNTVVNNNLYTNMMAQYNLLKAADVVKQMQSDRPDAYRDLARRYQLSSEEIEEWVEAAEVMYIPYNDELGIHPQDDQFLLRKRWNLDDPDEEPKRPLLLHYHPLTIYRHQIIKQADVVLALFLMGNRLSLEEKRADYDYYDPLTTGDSSLSAIVQSIVASEVGYTDQAMDFFLRGLYVDLANLHGNAADGVHVASAGGVWQSLVYGFGGFRDYDGKFSINPRLPEQWEGLTYHVTIHRQRVRVTVRGRTVEVVIENAENENQVLGPVNIGGHDVMIGSEPLTVVVRG